MWTVVITEHDTKEGGKLDTIERYRQTVDVLDIKAVMAAVNMKPRKERVRKGQES